MLIDLPVPEIQKYMVDFDLFLQRVSEAIQLVEQQATVDTGDMDQITNISK